MYFRKASVLILWLTPVCFSYGSFLTPFSTQQVNINPDAASGEVSLYHPTYPKHLHTPPHPRVPKPPDSFLNRFSCDVVTLNLGPAWSGSGETQTFYLQPDVEKTYVAKSPAKALGVAELFIGQSYDLNKDLEGLIGLAIASSGNAVQAGDVLENAEPAFNNYTYTYNVNQVRLLLKGLLLSHEMKSLYATRPYASLGLGIGFNQAFDYSEIPKICQEVSPPPFAEQTTTAFTYTLGFGVQKIIQQHWHMGLGYEFADWGNHALGRAPGQTLNSGLGATHLYTNELLISLTYRA